MHSSSENTWLFILRVVYCDGTVLEAISLAFFSLSLFGDLFLRVGPAYCFLIGLASLGEVAL